MRHVSLSDKYEIQDGAIFITAKQALSRLPLLQKALDEKNGLHTAGYVSGYRGSPLGTMDNEILKVIDRYRKNDIVFEPGLNEDLAVTAVWGSQQIDFLPGKKFDGVFGMWYGKGPGVDRSGDAIKHLNYSGTHPNGGVLLVFGDDHPGKSSSLAHQSDHAMAANEVPVLYPSNIEDVIRFGLAGFAMSRETGLAVSMKMVNDTADSTEVVEMSLDDMAPILTDNELRDVHIRSETLAVVAQDTRMVRHKRPALMDFVNRNRLDCVGFGAEVPVSLGIVTAGKSYNDVVDALRWLGIGDARAKDLGVGVLKVGLIYPMDPATLTAFARRAKELLFVEEKRPHMENQAAKILYNLATRPRISGKFAPDGTKLLPQDEILYPHVVASSIAARLRDHLDDTVNQTIERELRAMEDRSIKADQVEIAALKRAPAFCSGCPHNRSTMLPEGSHGVAGIGCHGLVQFMDRKPLQCAQMGGEGVTWVGASRFTNARHVFINLGDGTYSHSGSLAIRAAAKSNANVTYKILANGVVAMTGGQALETDIPIAAMARQVLLDGVKKVVVVAENPKSVEDLPPEVELVHRTKLPEVQMKLRDTPGTTVIIYVQTCATELRRRRKTGEAPEAASRVFINPAVCEGCGDCSRTSNCMSVLPLETELGRKRQINQANCNSDMSCIEGFCPSFVTLTNATRVNRKSDDYTSFAQALNTPARTDIPDRGWGMLFCGIGGTGVVTATAVLGMTAHLAGLRTSIYDMTGLAQKGGTVYSHLKILGPDTHAAPHRLGLGDASVLVASDLVAATQAEALATITDDTRILANTNVQPTQKFHEYRDIALDDRGLIDLLGKQATQPPEKLNVNGLAEAAFGSSVTANILMLGFIYQKGWAPLSLDCIEEAIRLNGVSIDLNLSAFALGRLAAERHPVVRELLNKAQPVLGSTPAPISAFSTRLEERVRMLNAYQNASYARKFEALVRDVIAAEEAVRPGARRLSESVMSNAYRVMAYKDEYEVARLHGDKKFWSDLEEQFEGGRAAVLVSPPLEGLFRRDGERKKVSIRAGVFRPIMHILARMKFLRGTPLDPLGWSEERRQERRLRDIYIAKLRSALKEMDPETYLCVVELAEIPRDVRGFGHVKRPQLNRAIEALERWSLIKKPVGGDQPDNLAV